MKTLGELIRPGFIREIGLAPSTGGRRPVMYSIPRIGMHDLSNNILFKVETHELILEDNADCLRELTNLIKAFISDSGIGISKILGVGIGMPGFIDVVKGVNYSYLHIEGNSLVSYVGNELNLPVYIDNDSSLIALAELRFGAARHTKNSMVLNMSWGVGLGMVLDDKIFRGHNGFAGEFSHIPLFANGKLCSCGKQGCLETEASLTVIIEKAIQGIADGKLTKLKGLSIIHLDQSIETFLAAVNHGDKFATELLSSAAYTIGRGVAILIHILNPEVIIISGRGSLAGKVLQAPIQHALNEHCIPRLAANTIIRVSELGMNAQLLGAAALVMENFALDENPEPGNRTEPAYLN
ncbi:MAG: ROK family protein [Chitinophagaceae bacterium]|nr:MAG: ROK family protein [Chitinophagaceae bacterium]